MAHNLFERIADECVDLTDRLRRGKHMKALLDRDFRIDPLNAMEEQRRQKRNGGRRRSHQGRRGAMVAIDFSDPDTAAAGEADGCGEPMKHAVFCTSQASVSRTIETLGRWRNVLMRGINDNAAVDDVAEKSSCPMDRPRRGRLGQRMADELLMADDKSWYSRRG